MPPLDIFAVEIEFKIGRSWGGPWLELTNGRAWSFSPLFSIGGPKQTAWEAFWGAVGGFINPTQTWWAPLLEACGFNAAAA